MRTDNPTSFQLPFRKKAALILLGFFLSLALLEIGMRLAGFAFVTVQEYRNKAALKQKGAYRILCLGESTTALGGGISYPSQLQEILNNRGLGIHFSVINKGTVGILTSYILKDLEGNLDHYRPDMVIAMMGINDAAASDPRDKKGPPGPVSSFFSSLKVFKLASLLRQHLVKKMEGPDLLGPGKSPNPENSFAGPGTFLAQDVFLKAIQQNPKSDRAHVSLGWCYMNEGKPREAEKFFKKAIELNPQNSEAYGALGWCYMTLMRPGEIQEYYFKKAIELSPASDKAYYELAWCLLSEGKFPEAEPFLEKSFGLNPKNVNAAVKLGWCYTHQGKFKEAEALLKEAIVLNPKDDELYGELAVLYAATGRPQAAREFYTKAESLRMADYNPRTRHNYLKIKEILDKRRVKFVCAQYPMRSIAPLRKIFEGQEGVIFVDNEKVFKDAVARDGYRKYFHDMFAGDFGHGTREGNRLLAENIADTLIRSTFH